jgi:pimeloyl-ACP methyl ester carboxylesterase
MLISVSDNVLMRSSNNEGAAAEIWCIPSAVNSGRSYVPLLDELRETRFAVRAIDFPGYGASPAQAGITSIDALADVALACIRRSRSDRPIVLVGHSLGSAVAVRVASQLRERAVGLFSIEGNLTADDGYLSALAADYTDPEAYKAAISTRLRQLLPPGTDSDRAMADFELCDAPTIWNVGMSSHRQGKDDRFGHELLSLRIPVLYYWGRTNTPPATVRFVAEHDIDNIEFRESGHWPMKDIPAQLARDVHAFAIRCESRMRVERSSAP